MSVQQIMSYDQMDALLSTIEGKQLNVPTIYPTEADFAEMKADPQAFCLFAAYIATHNAPPCKGDTAARESMKHLNNYLNDICYDTYR